MWCEREKPGSIPASLAPVANVPPLSHLRDRRGSFVQEVCLLVGCLTSQQQASVSQGRTCTDNSTCCHPEIEVADQTFYLTQSQYTDTGPTSPSADPIMPSAWQGSPSRRTWSKVRQTKEDFWSSCLLTSPGQTVCPRLVCFLISPSRDFLSV